MPVSKEEKRQFLEMLDRIEQPKIRYFYLMLGSAISHYETLPKHNGNGSANTGPEQLMELARGINE